MPGPSNFKQEGFFKSFFVVFFPVWVYVKQLTLGQRQFWPQGYNVNNLGKGPLDEIKYQMSKALVF